MAVHFTIMLVLSAPRTYVPPPLFATKPFSLQQAKRFLNPGIKLIKLLRC